MIEEAPAGLRHAALLDAAARRLADGRLPESVRSDLRKRGATDEEIQDWWPEIENRYLAFRQARQRRLRFVGWCWLLIGLVIPGGLAIYHGTVPLVMVLAVIPTWYGIYLLSHPIDREPSIEPPALFGRRL